MRIVIVFFFFAFVFSTSAFSQDNRQDEWIIQLSDQSMINELCKRNELNLIEELSSDFKIYLVGLNETKEVQTEKLRSIREIVFFEKNQKLKSRAIPNDPLFDQLWNMEIVDAIRAWDVSTGGNVLSGEEIVIAVLDEGFEATHEDLAGNLWINDAEINNNGIDDDSNGYVDDYLGANVKSNNGVHPIQRHGTAVAGIIGARGNNDLGVAGINWNTKMMMLSGIGFVSDIIKAYQYVYFQRKKYNDTNGQEGAYIVASNLSIGLSNVFASEFPIWCGLYDELGSLGILNVGSTDNSSVDVGVVGDMPSTCPSDHLIIVTNSTNLDELDSGAAYSNVHVDLGAPGDVLTLDINNNYRSFEGTSSSCPHVAGAIGLLYSVDCNSLYESSLNNPSFVSLYMKNVILDNVDLLPAFNGVTTSGGRLNVYQSMINMGGEICGSVTTGELEIKMRSPNPGGGILFFDYITNEFTEHTVHIYSSDGKLLYRTTILPDIFGDKFFTVNTEALSQGISFPYGYYIVSIENEKAIASTQFLVVN